MASSVPSNSWAVSRHYGMFKRPTKDRPRRGNSIPKRLVICCDGTWNTADERDSQGRLCPTNVTKVSRVITPRDARGWEQKVFYHKGVGTGFIDKLRGGAFGWGLSANVKDVYRFLIANYDPGDEMFFFGFSRGAYTARSTVGLIRNCGLLKREYANKLDDAYDLYRRRDDASHPDATEATQFRQRFALEPSVRFVGVWDTVGALGIPIDGLNWLNTAWQFHDVKLSKIVQYAYQALAIDERRKPFEPAIWERQDHATVQTVEQVWFAGVHSDVGGGYAVCGLSDIALRWMMAKAEACGLAFDRTSLDQTCQPDPLAAIHDSMTWFYKMWGRYVRPIGRGVNGNESVASTAVQRREKMGRTYDPENVRAYLPEGKVAMVRT